MNASVKRMVVRAVSLLAIAAGLVTVSAGSAAAADGTRGPIQTTWGRILAVVETGPDYIQVNFALNDNRCDGRGFVAGVRAYASGGGNPLHQETVTNANGCGNIKGGTVRFTASELEGHSSGYIVVSYGPRINGINYPWGTEWFSTFYSI